MELIQKYCCSIVPLYFIEHFDFIWLKMFTSSQQGFRFLLAVTVSYRRFISVAQRTFRNFVFPSKIFDANVCAERRSFVKLAADSVVTILIEFTLKWSEIVAIDKRKDESFWTAFTYTITSAIVASVAVAVALAIYNWNWIGGRGEMVVSGDNCYHLSSLITTASLMKDGYLGHPGGASTSTTGKPPATQPCAPTPDARHLSHWLGQWKIEDRILI